MCAHYMFYATFYLPVVWETCTVTICNYKTCCNACWAFRLNFNVMFEFYFRSTSVNSTMASVPMMSRSLSRKKKQKGSASEGNRLRTNYSATLRMGLPPCPELPNALLEQGNSALSKVRTLVTARKVPHDEILTSKTITHNYLGFFICLYKWFYF